MELFTLVVLGLSGLLLAGAGANRLARPVSSFCLQHYVKQPGINLDDVTVERSSHKPLTGGSFLLTTLTFMFLLSHDSLLSSSSF